MKKFSFFSTAVLVSAVAVFLFVSCQKEQNTVANETNTAASEAPMKAVAGGGPYAGSINRSYAASLAANYTKKYGTDSDQTQSVAFSANDLIAFINGLKTKYQSDIIYVNFGVYGNGAAPVNPKDWGRLTVYFTGNKIPAPSTGRRNDGILSDLLDDFLNHGEMFP